MHDAEYVLHLAARTSVPRSVKDPIEINKTNIDGMLNVLVAAKELKVKRVIFAASSSAYGETPALPKVETMQPQPISPYGVTKYVGELYCQTFGRCYGLETSRCAISTFWGRARTLWGGGWKQEISQISFIRIKGGWRQGPTKTWICPLALRKGARGHAIRRGLHQHRHLNRTVFTLSVLRHFHYRKLGSPSDCVLPPTN
jgi:hypothetical protein